MQQYEIREGTPVFTIDGSRLGEVKELRGDYFKVQAPMQPDYWLETACVRGGYGSGLAVAFDKDHVGDYKQDVD